MVERVKSNLGIILLLICGLVFYYPFLLFFKLPIPSDAIVGLYHPFRDFYAVEYPNGLPFKNFLITDPVRQTYIWKELSIDILRNGDIPAWNPYEMAGKPLAANIQTAIFYPLNIIFLLKPFYIAWSFFILLQTFLALIFSYFYLRNLKMDQLPSIVGSLSFAFSGFCISWLQWGNVIHSIVWLPLILLAIDKIAKTKKIAFNWSVVLVLSFSASLLAGHIQSYFYLATFSLFYFIFRWLENGKNKIILFQGFGICISTLILTVFQWLPGLRFIEFSARSMDQNFSNIPGWFLPWQNLVQFIAPDFFGNPTTLNYYGVWNYAEFVGYIGIIPFVLAFTALYKKNTTVIFYCIAIFVSLLFSLPTGISSIPFILNIPFISTAQPSRLIFIISFSLAILSAFGIQFYMEKRKNMRVQHFLPFLITALTLLFLWLSAKLNILFFSEAGQSDISQRNLVFPTIIFAAGFGAIILATRAGSKKIRLVIFGILVVLIFADLLRFANKFTPFTDQSLLFPTTKTIDYLKSQDGLFRIASNDSRILAPNIFTYYRLQSIEGYDPLYLSDYADYIAAMEQETPRPNKPYGFNRIITPHNYKSPLFDFLNVKYLLSLTDIQDESFELVFKEGQTKVYKNLSFVERAFFVENVVEGQNMDLLFKLDLNTSAMVEEYDGSLNLTVGVAEITKYSENEIIIKTKNDGDGFLVVSDAYYPTWKVFIDNEESKIYKTNHAFRGVLVPPGEHQVVMRNYLF